MASGWWLVAGDWLVIRLDGLSRSLKCEAGLDLCNVSTRSAERGKTAGRASVTAHFAGLCALPGSHELRHRWEYLLLRKIG